MPYFPDIWMNELLTKTDIVSLVSEYTSLSPKGGRLWGCCPLHTEKTPSFSVQPEKQMFYCFGCHAGGGAITFVMKAERLGFNEAVEALAQRAGMELPDEAEDDRLRARRAYKERLYGACKEAARFYHAQLKSDPGAQAREYLKKRGVDWATAVRFGLGFAPDSWEAATGHLRGKGFSDRELIDAGIGIRNKAGDGCYDAYRGRLIFPIIATNGRVLGFGARTMKKDEQPKYINTGDTAVYNKRSNLYAMNMQKGLKGELIMAEGYMDVISLHSADVTNVVASLGTAMTRVQARLVKGIRAACTCATTGRSRAERGAARHRDPRGGGARRARDIDTGRARPGRLREAIRQGRLPSLRDDAHGQRLPPREHGLAPRSFLGERAGVLRPQGVRVRERAAARGAGEIHPLRREKIGAFRRGGQGAVRRGGPGGREYHWKKPEY